MFVYGIKSENFEKFVQDTIIKDDLKITTAYIDVSVIRENYLSYSSIVLPKSGRENTTIKININILKSFIVVPI